ncbi:MAG: putative 4-hydroxybenzoate polyprenyltransferase, partial [Anaerolineales bacterium]|nr:putative 4-hydroxybenzoate polyprenyltransferase [Anaerolineales bacterium]
RDFLDLIKFEHTVFALPFAYMGMVLAAGGLPDVRTFLWITVAMAAARTLGMGANRLADRWIDARNPRTANRPLVTGAISPATAWAGTLAAALILALAAYQLGPLPFRLLPGAYALLVLYPFSKRLTVFSHLMLGMTDALAPLGAWAAVRGSITQPSDLPAWLLFVVVTLWIGGFDLMYALQDIDVDRRDGLYSVPAKYGVRAALRLSAAAHALMTLLLAVLLPLGWPYALGFALTAALLAYEHAIVRTDDQSRLNLAFFNVNGVISLTLFAGTLLATLLPG